MYKYYYETSIVGFIAADKHAILGELKRAQGPALEHQQRHACPSYKIRIDLSKNRQDYTLKTQILLAVINLLVEALFEVPRHRMAYAAALSEKIRTARGPRRGRLQTQSRSRATAF